MMPTPTPAPPMPMQAIPAPIYFAAVGSMRNLLFEGCLKDQYSMTRVNRIVEVDASQDGENVSLQQSHQQLERREHRRQSQRQGGAKPAQKSKTSEHHDEPAEHLQGDVTGEHVGEQPYAMGDRPRKE